ncbi:hypothetical protein C8R44DRAFT_878040 [Mycena epipterygia]|nr:hypothetical protein C8R44DRAFT_878040 [Mycena epipterygia]
MSLLCLSAADVARVTSNFSPEALQSLMAHVFSVLSRSDAENPSSAYRAARIAARHVDRNEDTDAVKAILNAANLTALRNAAALVGVDACARDAVDAFYGILSGLTALALSLCHPTFSDVLFQPEALYRVPVATFPKLSHLGITLTPPADLARFLL